MKKVASVVAGFAAILLVMGASAEAREKKPAPAASRNAPLSLIPEWLTGEMDPPLAVSNLVVSGAATGAYFAMEGTSTMLGDKGSAWAATTLGCMALSPIIGTLVVNRPLTQREVFASTAGCALPIVGPWLINRWFDHNGWDRQDSRVAIK